MGEPTQPPVSEYTRLYKQVEELEARLARAEGLILKLRDGAGPAHRAWIDGYLADKGQDDE